MKGSNGFSSDGNYVVNGQQAKPKKRKKGPQKGEKTQEAMKKHLLHRLNMKEGQDGGADLRQLQLVEKDKKIQDDTDNDVWRAKIQQQKNEMIERQMTLENKQKEKNGFTSSKLFKQKLQETNMDKKDENGPVKKRRCFVSVNNQWRQLWDYFIIFVAIYSTFMIPISWAFSPFK